MGINKKSVLICLIGNDGSGKTTLAKSLVSTLEGNGIKSRYVINRFEPYIMRPFLIIVSTLFFRGKDMFNNYTEYHSTKRKLFNNSFISATYKYILLIDYLLQTLLKVKIPLILGKNVICDRYVYDTLVSHGGVHLNYSNEKIESIVKGIFYLIPEPDLTFLIDVPEEIAYQRKDDIPSIDYLKERREIYLDLGRRFKMIILDGSKSLEVLENLLQKEVFQKVEIR